MVLLARIVDNAGRAIRPSQVAAIDFSIVVWGPSHSEVCATVAEQSAAGLVASDVVLPRLVTDDLWTIDVAGYNFRHELEIDRKFANPQFYGRVVLEYVFTSTDNIQSIVQFRLKLT